jgi:hypothetical protein
MTTTDELHTASHALADELSSQPFQLTVDERAAVIAGLRMLIREYETWSGNKAVSKKERALGQLFIERSRSVIAKIGKQ